MDVQKFVLHIFNSKKKAVRSQTGPYCHGLIQLCSEYIFCVNVTNYMKYQTKTLHFYRILLYAFRRIQDQTGIYP